MSYLAAIKRIVPFISTFVAGLLIASFFVPIASPDLSRFENGRSRRRECRRMNFEYDQLKRDYDRLKVENEMLKQQAQAEWGPHNVPLVLPEFDREVRVSKPHAPERPRHP